MKFLNQANYIGYVTVNPQKYVKTSMQNSSNYFFTENTLKQKKKSGSSSWVIVWLVTGYHPGYQVKYFFVLSLGESNLMFRYTGPTYNNFQQTNKIIVISLIKIFFVMYFSTIFFFQVVIIQIKNKNLVCMAALNH